MNLQKLKAKLNNYDLINKKLEADKNICLIKLLNLSQQNYFYYLRSLQSLYYLDMVSKIYEITHPMLREKTFITSSFLQKKIPFLKQKKHRTIWIYVTEQEKYQVDTYTRLEKSLDENSDYLNDLYIAVGKRAIDFLNPKTQRIIFDAAENDVESLSKIIASFLEKYLIENGFFSVKFVLNSTRVKTPYLTILPISDLSIDFLTSSPVKLKQYDLKKANIFPNVNQFIDSEFYNYLSYMALMLLSESALITQKYELVSINQKINNVEKRYNKTKREIVRLKLEHEIEEISIISKKKDLLHNSSTKRV